MGDGGEYHAFLAVSLALRHSLHDNTQGDRQPEMDFGRHSDSDAAGGHCLHGFLFCSQSCPFIGLHETGIKRNFANSAVYLPFGGRLIYNSQQMTRRIGYARTATENVRKVQDMRG